MSQETNYSAYNIIAKKRDGEKLTSSEIKWFIEGLTKGSIPDYQMSALLMAIYLQGADKEETASLTDAMLYSGRVLNFDDPTVVDKHSTGGVGDKTSFILAPIAAACGVKVPMIAGRGLGHTGGTVDKIESVEGFNTEIGLDEFVELVKEKHLVLIGQTGEIAPADKKIYALRDVTATVESIPLITASIMSKKLAEGASSIVMDIKYGQGAFMKTKSQAKKLAKSLAQTAVRFDKNMMTVLSDMNQPLGKAIGNSVEMIECFDTLKGNGPKDLTDISLHLAGGMIHMAGLAKSHNAGIKKAKAALKSGEALEWMRKLIQNQGGNPAVVDDYSLLPMASETTEVKAVKAGYLTKVDTLQLGMHSVTLGGGRLKAEDKIDFGVGIIFHKNIGDKIKEGECLATIIHHKNQINLVKDIEKSLQTNDLTIKKTKPTKVPHLIDETLIYWS